MGLDGQRVVIIGGSSGIGLAVARLAREQGAQVTIAGRSEERLQAASVSLGEVDAVRVDISEEASVDALFEPLDHVDHLVISAGTLGPGGITTSDLETLRAVIDQRLWGAVYAVRAAAPKMEGGSITLTSGGIASRPRAGAAMYTVALSAVEALTGALALELAPLRVNTITPGAVVTPLHGLDAEERLAARAATLPVGRVGTAEELAEAYLMLMQHGYFSGEVLHVDGGGRFV